MRTRERKRTTNHALLICFALYLVVIALYVSLYLGLGEDSAASLGKYGPLFFIVNSCAALFYASYRTVGRLKSHWWHLGNALLAYVFFAVLSAIVPLLAIGMGKLAVPSLIAASIVVLLVVGLFWFAADFAIGRAEKAVEKLKLPPEDNSNNL